MTDTNNKGNVLIIYELTDVTNLAPFSAKALEKGLTDKGWHIDTDYNNKALIKKLGWWPAIWHLMSKADFIISLSSRGGDEKRYVRSIDKEIRRARKTKKPIIEINIDVAEEFTAKEWRECFDLTDEEMADFLKYASYDIDEAIAEYPYLFQDIEDIDFKKALGDLYY